MLFVVVRCSYAFVALCGSLLIVVVLSYALLRLPCSLSFFVVYGC